MVNKKEVNQIENDGIIKEIKKMEKIYCKNISILEELEKGAEGEISNEYSREILQEIIYSTEYFLYRIKTFTNNPI